MLEERILVIGSPGSGKSTFARALGELTGLPLLYLDRLFWNADRTTVENQVFDQRLEQAMSQNQRWIMDGNYSRTLDRRLARCYRVFFLDYPVEVCLEGVRARREPFVRTYPGWRRKRTRSSWTTSGTFPSSSGRRSWPFGRQPRKRNGWCFAAGSRRTPICGG